MAVILNSDIILKDRFLSGYALLYTDKIKGIVKEEDIPKDCEIIDANGGYTAPGLIDLHIHGYLGKDVCDGSGESGVLILENAQKVLDVEFPELAKKMKLNIPDEKARRVGQSVAAASLPKLG